MNNLPFKLKIETDMEKYRAESFWNKEPETLVWIESFTNGDTFFDVGANIGIYALYAGTLYLDSKSGLLNHTIIIFFVWLKI